MSVCYSNGVILSDLYSVFNGNLWRGNNLIAPEFFGEYSRIDGLALILGAPGNLYRTFQTSEEDRIIEFFA